MKYVEEDCVSLSLTYFHIIDEKIQSIKKKVKMKNAIPQNVIKMKNAIHEDSYVGLIFLINFLPNKINRPNIFSKRHMLQDIYNKNNLSNLI